jgi:hypothetical protein
MVWGRVPLLCTTEHRVCGRQLGVGCNLPVLHDMQTSLQNSIAAASSAYWCVMLQCCVGLPPSESLLRQESTEACLQRIQCAVSSHTGV